MVIQSVPPAVLSLCVFLGASPAPTAHLPLIFIPQTHVFSTLLILFYDFLVHLSLFTILGFVFVMPTRGDPQKLPPEYTVCSLSDNICLKGWPLTLAVDASHQYNQPVAYCPARELRVCVCKCVCKRKCWTFSDKADAFKLIQLWHSLVTCLRAYLMVNILSYRVGKRHDL